MATSSTFSLMYIEGDEEKTPSEVHENIQNGCHLNMPDNVTFCSVENACSAQMMPMEDANERQEYVLLTPMTSCEKVDEPKNIIPANRILAESVRGLFTSNDSQSSYKSIEGNTSAEDYFDINYDDSSSEYVSSGSKKSRKRFSDDDIVDPFSDLCRIPLPGSIDGPYFDSKTFVRRRNERERARVRSVNEGFERLRAHLPYENECDKQRRLSKVETLQYAIQYIQHLQTILDEEEA